MFRPFVDQLSQALSIGDESTDIGALTLVGQDDLPSWFAVSDLASASIGLAGLALAEWQARHNSPPAKVTVDRRLASLWFGMTLRPIGWELPSPWDPIAGDYCAQDGWIRLHTNAPHHRKAALHVLGDCKEAANVEKAVAQWDATALESAIVEAGGCAAQMRDLYAWRWHPQGAAVACEPLVAWQQTGVAERPGTLRSTDHPLSGIKVLDLTRVLAGPVATRFLAAYGADVLRIDPPDWDEPGVLPEVTLGKRCAGLDLKKASDRAVFDRLLAGADVVLHGYRPGALDALGYDADKRRDINPALIDVSLNAYGWSGPWSGRRGFDSLVQMSCGIAAYGMAKAKSERPVPLPVQALDHATGYLLAASTLKALRRRSETGEIHSARLSLARTALVLIEAKRPDTGSGFRSESDDDLCDRLEQTDWGPARRIRFPISTAGTKIGWKHAAGNLRTSKPSW
ncbi:MAG: CoA transferase [Pseudomonadota bacterium]